jgi:lipopolysaccharide heptosyltransferase I
MNASPKILIIRLSSLGDILHALPASAGLRASFPDARIDWLVSKKFAFLLSSVRGIDALHVLDTSALGRLPPDRSRWRQLRDLIANLRAQHYDLSIDFQGLLKTAVLGLLSGSKTRLGFSKDLVRERPAHWFYHRTVEGPQTQVHVLVLNQILAELAGARRMPASYDFLVSEGDRRYVDSLLMKKQLEDYVVLNPGGGWPTKRWGLERYGILAKKIQRELRLQVVVTTGPGEETLYDTIAQHCDGMAPHNFAISFLQLIPLLQKARLFIGGDTGPFHLACALGAPVVGIFGPTSPFRNGPWRDGDEVVTHMLPCGACHGRTCPTNNECMEITVEEVFAAVLRRLQGDLAIARP